MTSSSHRFCEPQALPPPGKLLSLTARELARRMQDGSVRAEEIAESVLERIQKHDPDLRCYLRLDPDAIFDRARALDQRRRRDQPLGPLAGVPVALKDNLCTVGEFTTAGSRILADYRSARDAYVVERLRRADALIIGKTNLDEFAMGASTEHSAFGPTHNPHDLARVPGGSSGGSAAAVAASLASLALGSDTGGSVRQPAAFCGVFGLRPTYGTVSRRGLVAFASSLDQVGPLARTADDLALCFECIHGADPEDSTAQVDVAPADGSAPFRFGVLEEGFDPSVQPEIRDAVEETALHLEQLGGTRTMISLPASRYAVEMYYLVVTAEASSNLSRFDGMRYGLRVEGANLTDTVAATRAAGFGDEVQRRIVLGTFALSKGYRDRYYRTACRARTRLRREFHETFSGLRVLLGPTTPTTAFPFGARSDDPWSMYLCDLFTAPAALAGLPALSLPAGRDRKGLPIGVQLTGAPGSDRTLLDLARQLESQAAEETS